MSTFRQTCTQRVTARRVRYARAVQIAQTGEYLNAADLSEIKRYYNVKRQGEASVYTDSNVRVKKAIEDMKEEVEMNDQLIEHGLERIKRQASESETFTSCATTGTCLTLDNGDNGDNGYKGYKLLKLLKLLAILSGIFLVMNPPEFPRIPDDGPGNPPVDYRGPRPGEVGGGDLPENNPEAAALAPPGLKPVAVFPPFLNPPDVPVIAVIFSEDRASRTKRDTYDGYYTPYEGQYTSYPDNQINYEQYEEPSRFGTLGSGKMNLDLIPNSMYTYYRVMILISFHSYKTVQEEFILSLTKT